MTELQDYLEASDAGQAPEVDWNRAPWAAARAALHWLGLAPAPVQPPSERLTADEAKLLSDRMVRTFVDPALGLTWSSGRIDSALRAVSEAVAGPPEPFLRSLWLLLQDHPLDQRSYDFCRDIGRAVLGAHRSRPGWDLAWMRAAATPSQACLRYWTIGVKPSLWDAELERDTLQLLASYPYPF